MTVFGLVACGNFDAMYPYCFCKNHYSDWSRTVDEEINTSHPEKTTLLSQRIVHKNYICFNDVVYSGKLQPQVTCFQTDARIGFGLCITLPQETTM